MNKQGSVLLLFGPAGSGKSTTAEYIAKNDNWTYICEDDYWVKKGWGGTRTSEQEAAIQSLVSTDLADAVNRGEKVVLEFIVYNDPPATLQAYQRILDANATNYRVVALRPSLESILQRMVKRGREHDLVHPDENKVHAKNQLACLDSTHIQTDWIIDTTDLNVAEVAQHCIDRFAD